jgi:hypothetical protein
MLEKDECSKFLRSSVAWAVALHSILFSRFGSFLVLPWPGTDVNQVSDVPWFLSGKLTRRLSGGWVIEMGY